MNKFFISILALLVFAGSYVLAQPKLEIIGGDTYDWKKVTPKDNPLKTKIKIKNSGTERLIISEVKPGCGCTTAPLDKNELNPGEEATLDVTLRIAGVNHEITKTVRISSNDPVNKDKILYLKANIFQPLEIGPTSYFTFNEMKVGYESVASVKVKNNTDKNITLSDFEITPPETFQTNLKKKSVVLKPGEELEVVGKAKPDKKGYYNCSVKMKTNNSDMPELTISGYGQVKESPLFNN